MLGRSTIRLLPVIALLLASHLTARSQITVPAGSYVINMGVNATTKPAGLRPYGLIHELVKYYKVPIIWMVRQGKAKDAIDYTIEGVAYKGGLFVIPADYITGAVATAITGWTTGSPAGSNGYTRGLVTAVPLTSSYRFKGGNYDTIKSMPTWTLDAQNGTIAEGFFTNAGIPSTAYNYLAPSQLSKCNDVFVMPHADPLWASHGNLYKWNLTYRGAIWLGCHAGSVLENMYNPADTSQQTNFLSEKTNVPATGIILPVPNSTSLAQNALILFGNHKNASAPYKTNQPIAAPQTGNGTSADDWVSQFIGVSDAAHLNGSEQVFLPVKGKSWRSTTKIITYDSSQKDVPGSSSGAAAILAYGRGMGNPSRGSVMLEAGHSINKGSVGDMAAQRAFFNWSYYATHDKAIVTGAIAGGPPNGKFRGNANLSVTAVSPIGSTGLVYTWSAVSKSTGSAVGSFSPNATTSANNTTYSPGTISSNTDIIISVAVTDSCGRSTIAATAGTLLPAPRPPVAVNDADQISSSCYTAAGSKTIAVLNNDSDPDDDLNTTSVTLINPANAGQTGATYTVANVGVWSTNGTTVMFTPAANFFGPASIDYRVFDNNTPNPNTPNSATASVTLQVGTPDDHGCYPGSKWDVTSTLSSSAQTNTSVANPANAVGDPDYDPADNTTYSVINSNSDILTLDFGSILSTSNYDSVAAYFATATASGSVTATLSASTNGTTFTTLGTFSTTSNDPGATARFGVPAAGIRYLRIVRTAGSADVWVDAAQLEKYSCTVAVPEPAADFTTTLEDVPVVIDVLANDNNPGNLPMTLSIAKQPSYGKVSINTNGTITYLNTKDYPSSGNAVDTFKYLVCNSQSLCDTGYVMVTIKDDGCTNGNYQPVAGSVSTKVFSFGFAGTNAATANTTAAKFRDGFINAGSVSSSKGTQNSFEAGETTAERGLLYFDVSEIPTNSVVQSATLSLFRVGGDGYTDKFSLYSLTRAHVENQATWNIAQTGTNWTAAGGDFSPTALSTASVSSVKQYYNFDILGAVQNWVSTPANNLGLLLKTAETTNKKQQFAAKENGTLGHRPILSVTYLVPGACMSIPNRAPLSNPDNITATTSQPVSISPLGNDSEPDNNTMAITAASMLNTSRGAVSFTATGITYTPNGTAVVPRVDTLLYTVSDGTVTDQAYIFVTVSNAAPSINTDVSSGNSNTNQVVNVAANDSDPQSGTLSNAAITIPAKNGSVILSGNSLTYIPNAGFYGRDTLVYQRCQVTSGCTQGICDTAMVQFTVGNQAPTVTNKAIVTTRCAARSFSMATNVSDPEGEQLNITITGYNPAKGSIAVNPDGSYTYTPVSSFPAAPVSDTAQIKYIATDPGSLQSNVGTIVITVMYNATNQSPVAVNDFFNPSTNDVIVHVSQDIFVDALANDSDPDGDNLAINITDTSLKAPAYGTIDLFSDLIRYRPMWNYVGVDSFEYKICDTFATPGDGCPIITPMCSTALVTVRVDKVYNSGGTVYISGTVWNDINGSAQNTFNNIFTTGGQGTNAGNALFVYLVNSTGIIIDKATVSGDGTYTLFGAPANTSGLKLVLASANAQLGDAQPATSLPGGWANTSPLLNTSVNTGGIYLLKMDFSVEQLPIAGSGTNAATNPGGIMQVSVPANTFTNTAASTDPSASPNGVTSIRITTFPAGVTTIVIDGNLYTAGTFPAGGVTVPTDGNGKPTQSITIDPAGNGPGSVTISFVAIDAAGKESANTGSAVIKFTVPLSGTVFNDANWAVPLPVKLQSFIVGTNGCQAVLKWTTSDEIDISYYEVQGSVNGNQYVTLAKVESQGGIGQHPYTYTADKFTGRQLYRLAIVDVGGASRMTNAISVRTNCGGGTDWQVRTNPVVKGSAIRLMINSKTNWHPTVTVKNAVGQSVMNLRLDLTQGVQEVVLPAQDWAEGIYIINLQDAELGYIGTAQEVYIQ